MLVNLAAGNVGTVLLMGGRSTWVLMDKAAALAVNVAANLVLVPRFGITGAAVSWAVTIVLDSALAFGQVRWGMRVGGSLRGLVLAGLLALGCFAVVPGAVRMIAGNSLPAMSAAIVLSSALYLPMVWARRNSLGIPVLVQALSRRNRPS
jgi:O-antigen/teichoic acid export membrane protein